MKKCRLCYSYAVNPNIGDRKNITEYKDLCDVCFWKIQVHKYDCTKCPHYISIFSAGYCVTCTNNPTHQNHFTIKDPKG